MRLAQRRASRNPGAGGSYDRSWREAVDLIRFGCRPVQVGDLHHG